MRILKRNLKLEICLAFCGLLYMISATNAFAQPNSFTEGFDDITTLAGKGWVIENQSSPVGLTSWFQGTDVANGGANDGPFDAHSGATTSYIGANFQNTGTVGTISTWLISPVLNLQNGSTITFYTRTVGTPQFADRLQVRLSTAGASTNNGTTATDVGDFSNLLLDINPTLAPTGYPNTWTQYTITISGLGAPTTGRIAFRYFVTNGGSQGANSDYIGIDTFAFTSAATASGVSVSGRVLARRENSSKSATAPVGRATVTLTDMSGQMTTVRTDAQGVFQFFDVQPGETYLIEISSRKYRFAPQTIVVTENLTDLTFINY